MVACLCPPCVPFTLLGPLRLVVRLEADVDELSSGGRAMDTRFTCCGDDEPAATPADPEADPSVGLDLSRSKAAQDVALSAGLGGDVGGLFSADFGS